MDVLFFELAVVILTAGVVSLIAHYFKQPLIIAYMITGLVIGPSLFGLVKSEELLSSMSEIGIAFLLFLVGLNLNWKHIKDVGKIATLAGLGQIIFTSIFGFLIAIALDFNTVTSVLLGLTFALSSTIVIVKMLSDKEDIERFYGRITIGVLIVQDIVAMLIMLILGAIGGGSGGNIAIVVSIALIQGALAIIALWLIAKYILPHLFKYAASSQELLFLTSIAWCFAIASALNLLGFGIEIGALLAGITLAGSGFQREIESKVKPLRDFFLIIFFIILGTQLTFTAFTTMLIPAIIFSLFVLIGNPLIVVLILRAFGYHPRTGVLAGLSLAQVSEFSFIILASAIAYGIVSPEILSMVTLVGLITIGISSYLMKYNEVIYEKTSFLFNWLAPEYKQEKRHYHAVTPIIIFGYRRIGEPVIDAVKKMKQKYLIVDFNPKVIDFLSKKKLPNIYGDAGNEDFLQFIRAHKSKLLISTIPDESVNKDILRFVKEKSIRPTVILTAKTREEANRLYNLGASFVIIPHVLGGKLFADILKKTKMRKASWKTLGNKQKNRKIYG